MDPQGADIRGSAQCQAWSAPWTIVHIEGCMIPEATGKYWQARADVGKHMDQGSADAVGTAVMADSGEQHCA
jgi:hypothetical protein